MGASYEEVESKPASGQEEETRIIYKYIGREYSWLKTQMTGT